MPSLLSNSATIALSLVSSINTFADQLVFTSFRSNGEDGLHLAFSENGLNWKALNGDMPLLKPEVGGKLMRDPCIIQGPDGFFHMVWTTSWSDKGIGYANSKDLIHWSKQQFIPVMEHEAGARNCWAPEITWDPDGRQYVIYWATTLPGKFTETLAASEKGNNHRIYCTTTRDFKTYTPTALFYNPGFNVIDSTILRHGDSWLMITKDETHKSPAKNLHLASSDKVTGPWEKISEPFTPEKLWVEGATVSQVGEYWYVYFDCYRKHRYGAMRTTDFKHWEDVSDQLVVPEGMRHGTVVSVPDEVVARLRKLGEIPEPPAAIEPSGKTPLFNGESLDGWIEFMPKDDQGLPASQDVWSVRDGVIQCTGVPNGYIRTAKAYTNYKLHLEWRWTETPSNSGVLLHMVGKDRVWPTCVEAQLEQEKAGDFWLLTNGSIKIDGKQVGPARWVNVPKKHPSSEKPPGEWNRYDIVCDGGSIELTVNGQLQNTGTDASPSRGWICLQSEGGPIEFRNIYLEPIIRP
ncbi:family 16 glycoside hydrolase [Haloferula chungangensis]|uniref:Family 16 glycoside hydrolase n=1 Tax=Haloferula chungangensis TaxID=1048331 RepID=A0ABW2L4G6_9BACT